MEAIRPKLQSPLRYPGGKAVLAPFFQSILLRNDLLGCDYYEPFAGGAGAGLELLGKGLVKRIFINDIDPAVACFWKMVTSRADEFASRVASVELTVDEWKRQKTIFENSRGGSALDKAFSTFFLNRTSRSGLLRRAGPIGGFDQTGNYKIGARFTRDALVERILAIGEVSDRIIVSEQDGIRFLTTQLPRGHARQNCFAYIDPPYFVAGSRLYRNGFTLGCHCSVEKYLRNQINLRWVVTYDDAQEIRDIYRNHTVYKYSLRYSLARKQIGRELLVASKELRLPKELDYRGRSLRLTNITDQTDEHHTD